MLSNRVVINAKKGETERAFMPLIIFCVNDNKISCSIHVLECIQCLGILKREALVVGRPSIWKEKKKADSQWLFRLVCVIRKAALLRGGAPWRWGGNQFHEHIPKCTHVLTYARREPLFILCYLHCSAKSRTSGARNLRGSFWQTSWASRRLQLLVATLCISRNLLQT